MTLQADFKVELDGFTLDVSLTIEPGTTVAIVGPNGAGKTTLLRALAGIRPVSSGRIELNQRVLDDSTTRVFLPPERRSVGVVFQDNLLFPHLDALDNVAFGLRHKRLRKSEARKRAMVWLQQVDLGEQANAKPAELSGGQAQRVALVRALATEPQMLLLDEPLASLDATVRDKVRLDLKSQLFGFDGVRVLITHEIEDALALANEMIVLNEGRIVQRGLPRQVLANPVNPWIERFARSATKAGFNL